MKKLILLFAALTCCLAMKAQSNTYEPIMSIPSPINSDAVYYLGYQDGQDFYLHTSGTTVGQMQLSKNPENPVEYRFLNITGGVGAYLIGGDNLFLSIDTEGVAHKTFAPFSQTPFSLSIVNGDISSAAASGYTVCHDGNIITTHTGTSEGNLRFFVKTTKPSYNINVSVTPEGTGSATATIGGEQVESATEGTEITVTATPNAGYNFINWTENNEVVSTANPYTFTLTTDRNLVANFSRQYDFSATCTTDQTLYYRIIDAEKHWVSIVAPNDDIWDYAWYGFTKPKGDITLPETVTHNDISYTVKEIGKSAFTDCTSLTGSLTIPNSVTSIGQGAFYGCSGFTGSLTIGSSVTSIGQSAFHNCSGFTGSLTIPNSVTSIRVSAFELCSNFTGSLTIGNSVTNIGDHAFSLCSGFTSSLIIGSSVTSIGDDAFNNCSNLTNIIVKPATPPTLGHNVFSNMSNLQTITVPCGTLGDYTTRWGDSFGDKMVKDFVYDLTVESANNGFGSASITQQPDCSTPAKVTATPNDGYKFVNWTENGEVVSYNNPYIFEMTTDHNLVANFSRQYDFSATCTSGQTLYYRIIDAEKHWVSIVAPNNDTWDYGWNGFIKPTGNITLPETVTHNDINYTVKAIGNFAFTDCTSLTGSLTIPNSVTSIGEQAFGNCSGLTGSLTIGNSVTSIGDNAFYDCSGFTGSLTIGNSVTSIGKFAFYDCSGFTGSLTIGSSVTSIGVCAFELCSNFTGSLIIGSSVTNIGDNAFCGCSDISKIIAKPATPPTLGWYAFDGMTKLQTITVPCGKFGIYYNTLGDSFKDKMVEGFVYDLTVASANNGFGSARITQQPDCDTEAIVTATPNDGCKFVNWTENGVVVSTDNPYIFGMATDRNLVANFVENEIRITANQDPDHKQNYYATFYSSAADYQVPSDVTAYTGKVEDSTSEPNTSVLKLAAIEDNIIPASQGVILKLTTKENTETQKQFVITLTTEAGTWSGTNALTGTDVATTLGANQYALSYGQNGVGFYLWNGKEIGANKAYLTLDDNDDNEGGNAKAFTFQFEDDEATSIHNSQFIIHNSENDVMYNLNVVRVDENYKGIVIKNGKKVLQK